MNQLMFINVLASEAPNGKFIPGDFKEFVWGAIAFAIVAGLMAWKLGPVISKALSDAQVKAEGEATASDDALLAAQAEITAVKNELGDADAEGRRLITDAQEAANQLRVDENAKTQQAVNDMWERAQNEVVSMRSQAGADIQGEVSAQAVNAAEAVVLQSLDAGTHTDLIEDYIAKVASS